MTLSKSQLKVLAAVAIYGGWLLRGVELVNTPGEVTGAWAPRERRRQW